MTRPRFIARHRRLLTASLALHLLGALPAYAIPILNVADGTGTDSGSILIDPTTDTQALAAGFTLTSDFSNVAISASLTCLQCQAQFFLVADAIGPGTDFVNNVEAVTTVDTLGGGGFIDQSTSLFSSLNLTAGDYYLVLALTSDTISGVIWSATQSPLITAATGALAGSALMAQSAGFNSTTAPLSLFESYSVGGTPTSLQFTLNAAAQQSVTVPEPATGLLLISGLFSLFLLRRRTA